MWRAQTFHLPFRLKEIWKANSIKPIGKRKWKSPDEKLQAMFLRWRWPGISHALKKKKKLAVITRDCTVIKQNLDIFASVWVLWHIYWTLQFHTQEKMLLEYCKLGIFTQIRNWCTCITESELTVHDVSFYVRFTLEIHFFFSSSSHQAYKCTQTSVFNFSFMLIQ